MHYTCIWFYYLGHKGLRTDRRSLAVGDAIRTMLISPLKVGDRVVMQTGPRAGHDAHVIGITCNESDAGVITIRFYASGGQVAVVTPDNLRMPQRGT